MAKKVLSINLWYHMYKNKTEMQLKCFRKLGYTTRVGYFEKNGNVISVCIYESTDDGIALVLSHDERDYFSAFSFLFNYCINEKYDFIYIRRLMLKIAFATPYFKKVSKVVPIVYEIPTFPIDKAWDIKLSIRNTIELFCFNLSKKYFTLIPVVLCDNVNVPNNWLPFLNSIDIEEYYVTDVPPFENTIKLFVSSNLAPSHCLERLLTSIKSYSGPYRIELTIVSKDTPSYRFIKEQATILGLNNSINFLSEKTLSEVIGLGGSMHIGVGILTYNEPHRTLDTSLKTKDYCAIGLPFFSSCKDLSFPAPFPYHYVISNDTYDIDLNTIIEWYLNIRKDSDYKQKMYDYAKNNLQYDKFAQQIIDRLGLN
ncbi:MAG: hypothetical protein Q4D29_11295 [Lachnospiraceae bacterium]|nr:hypothetical protein [Lachnospiraceae bacterium]